MPNHLANESSPYLLQHQNNPVNWYPWGDEAIQLAKSTTQPIFLSIGYSACHWCHVMEHESFENEAIAEFLNSNFVSIKVDREERPDLDQIYMNAVQMISGRGGWPMSVFLTPDLQPFFGGTYWPPMTKMGMPGFDHVLAAVLDAWNNRREQAIEQAAELTERIARIGASTVADRDLNPDECMRSAAVNLEQAFDFTFGGFGGAPKFPHSMDLQVLLRIWKKNPRDGILGMVSLTLDRMAAGGIYDHLAGGFARYSVDARWLVPHFEKMLYDNALLTLAYLEAYQATGNEFYQQTITETLSYILNYMTDTDGGFHSTEDADSEGEEGKFYVWNPSEIAEILGAAAAERFCYVYDVSEEGNFEGKSILNLPKSIEQCAKIKNWNIHEIKTRLAEDRAKLLSERDRRIRPAKDDKIIVSWNGLMIDAMARAGAVLGNEKYISAAKKAANFIRERLYDSKGRLLHTYRHGEAKLAAYLDDYACFANACVSLYQATFDEEWISRALQLMEDVLDRFSDSAGGALFYTADDHEQLIARNKDLYDSSVPSGNAMAAYVLARLGKLTGQSQLLETAYAIIRSAAGVIQQSPTASGQMLIALDLISEGSFELVLLGGKDPQENASLVRLLQSKFLPNCVLAYRDEESSANSVLDGLFAGRSVKPDPQLFVCEGTACREPVLGCDNIIDILATL